MVTVERWNGHRGDGLNPISSQLQGDGGDGGRLGSITMNITLIGMAGVGKSVIGKQLARRLDYKFIDTDVLIEQAWNLKLQEIIDRFGDQRFLEIEKETILRLAQLDHTVISPGGSVVYSQEAMKFLKENSIVVFLDARIESIQKRISDQTTRGIVGLKGKDLRVLFQERRSLYQTYADKTIKIPENATSDTVAEEIIKKIFTPEK